MGHHKGNFPLLLTHNQQKLRKSEEDEMSRLVGKDLIDTLEVRESVK